MPINLGDFRPLHDHIFVTDLDRGAQVTPSGIIIPDDNMTVAGARPRWGKVYAIGPKVDWVEIGDWLLIEHARWTNRIDIKVEGETVSLWRIENKSAIILSDRPSRNDTYSFKD